MDKLFSPQRVAVIGVSDKPENLARNIVENLFKFGFPGEVYMVGKSQGVIFGQRILSSVSELPFGLDLAIVLTPAHTVPGIIEECGLKEIPWVVVESGGFGEYSEEGKKIEEDLLTAARKWGMRIVGPNGIGVMNPCYGLVCPFFPIHNEALKPGKVAVLSQSGGALLAVLNLLGSGNIGISKAISMGNKLDLNEVDYLEYLIEDRETEIIAIYLESIADGRRFMEIARGCQKPIILQKVNTSSSSAEIARFHTSALAGDDRVLDAVMRQCGVIRVKDFRSMVNHVKVFSLPPMKGNRLVIISRSGGMAIVAADLAEECGFHLAPLSNAFLEKVQSSFRAKVIRPTNPLDLGDLFDFKFYTEIAEEVLRGPGVDGILFQHAFAPGQETEKSIKLANALHHLSETYKKPLAICYLSDEQGMAFVKKSVTFPLFTEPGEALPALASYYRHCQTIKSPEDSKHPSLRNDKIQSLIENLSQCEGRPLLHEALEIVAASGIDVAPYSLANDPEEALKKAREWGYPVVLKLNLPSILHKTELNGFILNIQDEDQLRIGFHEMMERSKIGRSDHSSSGLLIQKMVTGGKELILGGKHDPSFGPIVLIGLGGIYAEIFKDISLRAAPITEREAIEMIEELKGIEILQGTRGSFPSDLGSIKEALLKLSQLMAGFPQIKGIDINPLIVLEKGKGSMAVDARII